MNVIRENPIVLALDVPSKERALQLANECKSELQWLKVGMRLFYAAGPQIVSDLKSLGYSVFLDLKLHDIPNTVSEAVISLLPLSPNWITVHASGGYKMLKAAQDSLGESRTKLVAVTCLTSLSAEDLPLIYPGLKYTPSDWVCHLAEIALNAGLTHLVCSPQEVSLIRQRFGGDVTLITPGVRPAIDVTSENSDDQSRTMTPQAALSAGANYLVIGRPILKASHPVEALHNINEQINHLLIAN